MRATAKYICGSSSNQATLKRTLSQRDVREAKKSDNSHPGKIHCLEDTSGQVALQEGSNKMILRCTGERHRVPLSAINENCNATLSATKLILQGVLKIFKKQPKTPELPKPEFPLAMTRHNSLDLTHTRPGYTIYILITWPMFYFRYIDIISRIFLKTGTVV